LRFLSALRGERRGGQLHRRNDDHNSCRELVSTGHSSEAEQSTGRRQAAQRAMLLFCYSHELAEQLFFGKEAWPVVYKRARC